MAPATIVLDSEDLLGNRANTPGHAADTRVTDSGKRRYIDV